jgi:hypothetical protein
MLDHSKGIAKRATLDPAKWDLKTFRSTYVTRPAADWLRCSDSAALDGTQIIGDNDAVSGASAKTCAARLDKFRLPVPDSSTAQQTTRDRALRPWPPASVRYTR